MWKVECCNAHLVLVLEEKVAEGYLGCRILMPKLSKWMVVKSSRMCYVEN